MTLTKDFDDMYLKQQDTFASQDEVDEELQVEYNRNKMKYIFQF